MIDDPATPNAPSWFGLAAIGALLWEILGACLFALQVITDPATLTRDEQAMWSSTPMWMNAAWGFAVVTGLAGAILLVMRHRRSEPVLLLSFLAVAVQFSGLLLVPALRNLTTSDDLFGPFVIVLVCYGIWHLARVAGKSGWLG